MVYIIISILISSVALVSSIRNARRLSVIEDRFISARIKFREAMHELGRG